MHRTQEVAGSSPASSTPLRSPARLRVEPSQLHRVRLKTRPRRIAARTDEGVRLLGADGNVLRDFASNANAAALSAGRLALRTADAVEVYDTTSGQLTHRFPVPNTVRLDDLEGDILVTASGTTVTLRSLGDGRTTTLRAAGTARAQLDRAGLFLAGTHRVTFSSIRQILRLLGS